MLPMTTPLNAMDLQIIRDSFRGWYERESSLDGQLTDSLAALEAYQSHLDAWQCELVAERESLEHEREQLGQVCATAEDHAARLEKVSSELNEARGQVAALSKTLLDRTEELRQLDGQRAELATQLGLARARERELTAKIDEQCAADQQPQWAEELKHLRELLERQMEPADLEAVWQAGPPDPPGEEDAPESPVLGSIVAQFGKLRQQRAQVQRGRKKTG
jgi:chromosome segregation ATPase